MAHTRIFPQPVVPYADGWPNFVPPGAEGAVGGPGGHLVFLSLSLPFSPEVLVLLSLLPGMAGPSSASGYYRKGMSPSAARQKPAPGRRPCHVHSTYA